MKKFSWIILTHNRAEIVRKSVEYNFVNMGESIHRDNDLEIIWCDNGSDEDGITEAIEYFAPDVVIMNKGNLGVAKGYNRALALATGEYVVITGCDMLMPLNWLETFHQHITAIPGIACMYSRPLEEAPERARGGDYGEWKIEERNGLTIAQGMPIGRRILSRELLREIGYFHEGLGLYGWDDVVWADRAERVCEDRGLMTYVIPDQICEHLGKTQDSPEYKAFKEAEAKDPEKQKVIAEYRRAGCPRVDPYGSN